MSPSKTWLDLRRNMEGRQEAGIRVRALTTGPGCCLVRGLYTVVLATNCKERRAWPPPPGRTWRAQLPRGCAVQSNASISGRSSHWKPGQSWSPQTQVIGGRKIMLAGLIWGLILIGLFQDKIKSISSYVCYKHLWHSFNKTKIFDCYSLILISHTLKDMMNLLLNLPLRFKKWNSVRLFFCFVFPVLSLYFFSFSSFKLKILITKHIEMPYKYQ